MTYQSGCSLFSEPGVPVDDSEGAHLTRQEGVDDDDNDNNDIDADIDADDDDDGITLVLVDLETSGFAMNCAILQIAMKCGKKTFSIYINPSQDIPMYVTGPNNLSRGMLGGLVYQGIEVPCVSLSLELKKFHQSLVSIGKKCVIAIHNLGFDRPRLVNALNEIAGTVFKSC